MGFVIDKEGVAGIEKDPDSVLDYQIDWGTWLESPDTITASTWVSYDPELVVGTESHTDTKVIVWLSGGVAGKVYTVTNHIVTVGGREEDRSFQVTCKEL